MKIKRRKTQGGSFSLFLLLEIATSEVKNLNLKRKLLRLSVMNLHHFKFFSVKLVNSH